MDTIVGEDVEQRIMATSKVALKIQRWERRIHKASCPIDAAAFQETVLEAKRKRTRKHKRLTDTE